MEDSRSDPIEGPGWGIDRDGEGAELKHYINILRRRFWIILAVFVIITTLAVLYAFKSTPIYQGEARLLIEKQTPRIMEFQDVARVHAADSDYYSTQVQLAQSRTVLQQAASVPAVRRCLKPDPARRGAGRGVMASLLSEVARTGRALMGLQPAENPPPPEPWERLKEKVTVDRMAGTHLLSVRAESPHAERAAAYANAVAEALREYHLKRRQDLSSEAFTFLEQQKKKQEQKLSEAEAALQKFRREARLVTFPSGEGEKDPTAVRLEKLNRKLTDTQLERITLESQVNLMRRLLADGSPAEEDVTEEVFALPEVRGDVGIVEIRTELTGARKELAGLSDTYGPGHPQLTTARARVDFLEEELAEALDNVVGSLSNRLEILREEESKLRAEYQQQQKTALAQSQQMLEYTRLKNTVERNRKLFDVLVERMGEVDLTSDYPKTNVEIAESADVPESPVSPRKFRIIVLGAFLSLVAGGGLALLCEQLDDTVKTPEDLEERVGLPVLGFVPRMNGQDGDSFEHRALISHRQPASSASEAYRGVRTSLFFSSPERQARVVAVTSGSAEAGKSTTVSNLACVMAQNQRRVLLVDADLRRSTVHRTYRVNAEVGLSTVLAGRCSLEDAAQSPGLDGGSLEYLDVLPAGPAPPNPAELLDSDAMRSVLEGARERYDAVLLDTPPVLFAADASIVAAMADGVILVVKSGQNSRSLVRRSHQRLGEVNARVLGGVLNDVRLHRLQKQDSAYAHYGYSRYYHNYRDAYYRST